MDRERDFVRGAAEIAEVLQGMGVIDPAMPAEQAKRRASYLLQNGSVPGTKKIRGLGWIGYRSTIAEGFLRLLIEA